MEHRWQAYKCTGYHHGILVIESLDIDSETRRLSPVALLSNEYIDLYNGTVFIPYLYCPCRNVQCTVCILGPQDHGWCDGRFCRERLSTFWTIVAFNNVYDLYFSGRHQYDDVHIFMMRYEMLTALSMNDMHYFLYSIKNAQLFHNFRSSY